MRNPDAAQPGERSLSLGGTAPDIDAATILRELIAVALRGPDTLVTGVRVPSHLGVDYMAVLGNLDPALEPFDRHLRVLGPALAPCSAVVRQPEKRPRSRGDLRLGAFEMKVVAARQRHPLDVLEQA